MLSHRMIDHWTSFMKKEIPTRKAFRDGIPIPRQILPRCGFISEFSRAVGLLPLVGFGATDHQALITNAYLEVSFFQHHFPSCPTKAKSCAGMVRVTVFVSPGFRDILSKALRRLLSGIKEA
jgi:hypothetical protein